MFLIFVLFVFFLQVDQVIYLVRWQKAEHTLGHDLADVEQQCAHLVLEGKCFCVLEGSAELSAGWSSTNSPHPHLEKKKKMYICLNLYNQFVSVCNNTGQCINFQESSTET